MSVMNRKMFSNRDARTKLAGMGGILSSSPELMGATQRFETGGGATPRGVPDSPRLSESLVPRSPVAIIGSRNFYLSEDGNYIVDEKGNVVREPSILNAVLQKLTGESAPAPDLNVVPEIAPAPVVIPRPSETLPMNTAADSGFEGEIFDSALMRDTQFLPPQPEQGIASVLSDRGVPPEATANRQAALARLKEQFSELSLFPERDSGGLETIILNQPEAEVGDGFVPRHPGDTRFQQELLARDNRTSTVQDPEPESGPVIVERSTAADPFGPEALAARAAMQERENQERLSIDAKLDTRDAAAAAQQDAAAQVSVDRLAASAGFVGEDEPTTTDFSTITNPNLEKLLSLNPRNPNPALIDEILMRSTPRTDAGGGIDSDFDADLSPDMIAELNRLEKLRTARGISEKSNPVDQFFSGANLVGGAVADTVAAGSELGLEGLGYISGGGGVSDFFFDRAEGARNYRAGLRGGKDPDAGAGFFDRTTKNFAPRLINPSEGPTVEAAAELERAEIEQDSIRAYADAVISGNTDLFAEGSVADGERSAFSELDQSSPVGIGPLDTGLLPNELAAIAANNTELGYTDDDMGLTTGFEQADITSSASPALTDDDMGLPTGPDFQYVAPNVSGTSGVRVIPNADANGGAEIDANGGAEIDGDDRNYLDKIIDRFNTNFDEFKNREGSPKEVNTVVETDTDTETVVETDTDTDTDTVVVPKVETVVVPKVETVVNPTEVIPPGIAVELADRVAMDPDNASETVSLEFLKRAGVDSTGMDIKQRTVAMKKILSDLMGKTPDDKKEEFWMNMAMMSFAVAAGESPDALKNLTNGMLAGTATIQQGKASDKKLDTDITLAAINQVFSEDAAAASQASAEKIAGMRTDGSGFRNLRNPEEFRQNQFALAYKAFNDNPMMGPPRDAIVGETDIQYATRKANDAYDAMIRGETTTVNKPLTGNPTLTEAELRKAAAAKLKI